MSAAVVLIIILLDIPLFIKISNMLYPDKEELREAFRFLLTPDLVSLFRGKYLKDRIAEFKLGLLFMICVLIVFCEFAIVNRVFLS